MNSQRSEEPVDGAAFAAYVQSVVRGTSKASKWTWRGLLGWRLGGWRVSSKVVPRYQVEKCRELAAATGADPRRILALAGTSHTAKLILREQHGPSTVRYAVPMLLEMT